MNKKIILLFVLVAVCAGIIGYMLSPRTPADEKAIEFERKIYLKKEIQLKKNADSLVALSLKIAQKHKDDSIFLSKEIQKKEIIIYNLKKRINEISLKHASVRYLDSLRVAMYGTRP